MSAYRFRIEGELLVLQVQVWRDSHFYGDSRAREWRDAKVEDIPVFTPFTPPPEMPPAPWEPEIQS